MGKMQAKSFIEKWEDQKMGKRAKSLEQNKGLHLTIGKPYL